MIDSDSPAHQSNRWRGQTSARWQEWRGLVLLIALLIFLRSTVVDWNHVPTRSMVPSIIQKQVIQCTRRITARSSRVIAT